MWKRPGKYKAEDIPVGTLVRFEDADAPDVFPRKYEALVDSVHNGRLHAVVKHVWDRDSGGVISDAEEVGAQIWIDEAQIGAVEGKE